MIIILENGMKIIVGKDADPRNVRLFNEVLKKKK